MPAGKYQTKDRQKFSQKRECSRRPYLQSSTPFIIQLLLTGRVFN